MRRMYASVHMIRVGTQRVAELAFRHDSDPYVW
jgi:hypothetical protein